MLDVGSLEAGYGTTEILRGIDLTMLEREMVAMPVANGAGKFTLMRAFAG